MNESIVGIGIDQGIAKCGFSVVQLAEGKTLNLLKSGTISISSTMPLSDRIALLYRLLVDLVDTYKPSIIGCEKLFFNAKQRQADRVRNKSAAIVYTNMATGVLYLIAGQKRIFLYEFVPTTIKKYVAGKGNANKEQVEKAILDLFAQQLQIKSSHESDAIAIGVTAVKYFREQFSLKETTKRKE